MQGSGLCVGRRGGQGAVVRAAVQREEDDGHDDRQNEKDEDTAFRSGCASAEQRFALRMGGEQMEAGEGPAVGDAVEERLCPVP